MTDSRSYVDLSIEGPIARITLTNTLRKEGYEVRLMIQKICNTFGFTTEEDVKRVETVIANELPGNVRSQENVYNWLVEYFETH